MYKRLYKYKGLGNVVRKIYAGCGGRSPAGDTVFAGGEPILVTRREASDWQHPNI